MSPPKRTIHIVGAGLAGSECAFQLAENGFEVKLYEMRPDQMTPAHKTGHSAELVCSNSFGSETDYSAPGQLKWEAERLGSLILSCAREFKVPAGMALGVDRERFAQAVHNKLASHPKIEFSPGPVLNLESLPRPAVVATGPLTHPQLAQSLQYHFDSQFLYFFDAIAPIVDTDSIDFSKAWKANRYEEGEGDYINCPLSKDLYYSLIEEIRQARKIESKEFEKTPYFEGCMPIEAIIERGPETLRFGPFSPKGLPNPNSSEKPYAVLQLRQDNLQGTAYNLVGCQTKMAYGEQTRIFPMIPGLEEAEFLKLGSIHRNLYIHSPKTLTPYLSSKKDPDLYFAGQITGVEGYFESTCIGLLVSRFIQDRDQGKNPSLPPRDSALGSLLNGIIEEKENFQPTNINFSLFPAVEGKAFRGRKGREKRRDLQLSKAKASLNKWLSEGSEDSF